MVSEPAGCHFEGKLNELQEFNSVSMFIDAEGLCEDVSSLFTIRNVLEIDLLGR